MANIRDIQPTDLVRLDDEPGFEITCLKCGSGEVVLENDIRFHESCTTGSLDLLCKKCGNRSTLHEPT